VSNYTPGPWEIKPEEAHRDYIRVRGTMLGGTYKIANVCSMKLEGNGKSINEMAKEAQANARLIAAAPELLDVLRMTSLDLHASDDHGECRCSQCNFRREALRVIIKATTP